MSATATQATNARVAAPKPNWVSATHRKAWAHMPTATGHATMCSGVEKKHTVCGDGDTGGDYVLPQGDGSADRVGRQGNAEQR